MNTTTQRPTPETDAAIQSAILNEDEDHGRLAAVSRKLERERDEALALLREHNAMQALAYKAERDEACKQLEAMR